MLELLWWPALLLLPLPWLMRRLPPGRSREGSLRAPFFREWQSLRGEAGAGSGASRKLLAALLALCWLCLLAGLARPVWLGEAVAIPASGRDLLLAVDISGSMRVDDMAAGRRNLRRIDSVKEVVGEFIQRRRGDRLGLILFGSQAYLQAPLTFDGETVRRFLQEAELGFAGAKTAIGDAIGLAVKRLRQRPAESRVLILLTDGANTAGAVDPRKAAGLAAESGVRIHTVGIGADTMETRGFFGLGSRTINPSAELDEDALLAIADATGGRYFRARDPAALASIYRTLDELEPVEQEAARYRPRNSLFHWPLALAFLSGFAALLAFLGGSFGLGGKGGRADSGVGNSGGGGAVGGGAGGLGGVRHP